MTPNALGIEWPHDIERRAIHETIKGAADLTDGSDELRRAIRSPLSRLAFSSQRSQILAPLDLGPRQRVVCVASDFGALARALGERCRSVLAVDPTPLSAAAAADRCRDLDNVTVVSNIEDSVATEIAASEPFDLVCVVAGRDGLRRESPWWDPLATALACVSHLAVHGTLAIAFSNQVGLRGLLGYADERAEAAWIGLEAMQRSGGAPDLTYAQIDDRLKSAGFGLRSWQAVFPDHHFPTRMFPQSMYKSAAGLHTIDRFVRDPVVDRFGSPRLVANSRAAHGLMLRSGVGWEVANSYLVVARKDDSHIESTDEDQAWIFSGERRRAWRRTRSLRRRGADWELGLVVGPVHTPGDEPVDAWLTNGTAATEQVIDGEPLDLLLAKALSAGQLDQAADLLSFWRAHLERQAFSPPAGVSHPFLPVDSQRALPGNLLDANLDNFVVSGSQLYFIDTEIVARGGVDFELVTSRALYSFAVRAVLGGWQLPMLAPTVGTVAQLLADLAGIDARPSTAALASAEAALQFMVTGADPAETRQEFEQSETAQVPRAPTAPELRVELERSAGEVLRLSQDVDELRCDAGRLEGRVVELFDANTLMHAAIEEREAALLQAAEFQRQREHDVVELVEAIRTQQSNERELRAALDHSTRDVIELRDALIAVEQQLETSDSQHRELRSRVADLEEQLAVQISANQAFHARLDNERSLPKLTRVARAISGKALEADSPVGATLQPREP